MSTSQTFPPVVHTVRQGVLIETYNPAYYGINPEHYSQLVICGGITVRRLNDGMPSSIPDVITEREHVILALGAWASWAKEDELNAMIDHEMGHIVLGHVPFTDGLSAVNEDEIAADLHSANIHGAETVARAIRSGHAFAFMASRNISEEKARSIEITDELILTRLAILDKMSA